MKNFDRYIKEQLSEEEMEVPDSVRMKIDQALMSLPEKEVVKKIRQPVYASHKFAVALTCFLFVFMFLLPNVSVVYAQAVEKIPIIGEIVKVITIRNYFYSDDTHELDVNVPKIEDHENEAVDAINADAAKMTEALVQKFYRDLDTLGEGAHGSVYVDYEVITNTKEWFTLKLCVTEEYGSSAAYYKYYHLNKLTGETANLSDIVEDEGFYETVENEIKKQMIQRMEADKDAQYWVDKSPLDEDLIKLDPDHNYYWNEKGDLVIPFDKYEVAPGSMGTPEFIIEFDLVKDMLKTEK